MSMECGSPFLLDGCREFAVISIQGQSFMLHQIRKMIGLVIGITKGYATEDIFEKVFKTERVSGFINTLNLIPLVLIIYWEFVFGF